MGAQFVDDVAPYEFMKLRLLNASHLAVAGVGRLAGYVTIDEAMADPLISRYMTALMDRETGPTLPPVPGIDLPLYKATLVERFANPAIKDTVERVNTDAPLNILRGPDPRPAARRRVRGLCWRSRWRPGCVGCAGRTSRVSRSMSATRSRTNCARRRSRVVRTRARCWGSHSFSAIPAPIHA